MAVTVLIVHALAFAVAASADDRQDHGQALGQADSAPVSDAPERPPAFREWFAHVAAVAGGDPVVVPGTARQGLAAMLVRHLGPTLILLAASLGVAVPLGALFGVLGVDLRSGRVHGAMTAVAAVGFAMPAFYFGILGIRGSRAMATFAGSDAWLLPASGYGLDRHLVLPALALAIRPAAELAQLTAELLASELGREYLRLARAKGGARWRVLRHAMANIAPIHVAAVAASLRYLISSAIVVELLFNWPGIGLALARSVAPRIDGRPPSLALFHPPTVAALMATWTLLYFGAALFAEVAAWRLDPRQRDGWRVGDR